MQLGEERMLCETSLACVPLRGLATLLCLKILLFLPAAGGAIGDERRQGMGDIARGQL